MPQNHFGDKSTLVQVQAITWTTEPMLTHIYVVISGHKATVN